MKTLMKIYVGAVEKEVNAAFLTKLSQRVRPDMIVYDATAAAGEEGSIVIDPLAGEVEFFCDRTCVSVLARVRFALDYKERTILVDSDLL